MPAIPTPPFSPTRVSSVPEDLRGASDTASIRSSHTLQSVSASGSHPEITEPGLGASIVEMVTAWFTDGQATKSSVVGELALAYNPVDSVVSNSWEPVRLENFHVLEKVAANPAFVAETKQSVSDNYLDDKKGEYAISLQQIARPIPTVAFKYQVHLTLSNLSNYCPVIFTPIWNMEERQASVIINYSTNPHFVSASPSQLTLKNFVLTVHLDLTPEEDETTKQPREVARAVSAAMYPNTGASFRRKLSAVTWKIPSFDVTPGVDGRFLARFLTAVPGPKKGKVEAKFDVLDGPADGRLAIAGKATTNGAGDDPFADESIHAESTDKAAWKELPTKRKLSAVRYISS